MCILLFRNGYKYMFPNSLLKTLAYKSKHLTERENVFYKFKTPLRVFMF